MVSDKERVVAFLCPQQICVRTGWIRRAGELIVCLPHRIVLSVQGTAPGIGVDAVVR